MNTYLNMTFSTRPQAAPRDIVDIVTHGRLLFNQDFRLVLVIKCNTRIIGKYIQVGVRYEHCTNEVEKMRFM